MDTKGTKSWQFRFSWAGKQPRISLGIYPEIGLRHARALRDIQGAGRQGYRSSRPATPSA
ncbi:Arm DNA-binding domain-containing protein [Pseudomonas sp. Z2-11]